jgi:glycosyltransferase involved in cell wall biosynthesis
MNTTCAVVVPCYNEARRLDITAFRDFLRASPHITFVMVNDGSTDGTADVLRNLQSGLEDRVEVLALERNSGKAEAVRRGLLHALDQQPLATAVGFWDADLATPLSAIYDLARILDGFPSIHWVFGARVNLLGRNIARRPGRHYLGRVFATVVSTLLRLPIYDTQCGAKLFRSTPEFRGILHEPFDSRWVFDVEMIARLVRLHRNNRSVVRSMIYEFPLYEWRDIAGSKVEPKDFTRAVIEVLAIWRKYLRY